MTTIELDATNKILGRFATVVANTLRGKNTAQYRPDRQPDVTVVVKNVAHIKVTGRKREQTMVYHFSGYPGGLKSKKLGQVLDRQPDQALRQAVKRMLPDNRLRARFLKRLIIE